MKKIKKIKINLNGKVKSIAENYKIYELIKDLKIPLKKKEELMVPSNPERHYKVTGQLKGKFSWGDVLGTGYVATFERKYKRY